MSSPKSLTELAMMKRRAAHVERTDKPVPALAAMYEQQADDILELPRAPDVGVGGEVVREQTSGLPRKRVVIRDTLAQGADRIAEDASIRRTDLLMQRHSNVVAMGVDAAENYALPWEP